MSDRTVYVVTRHYASDDIAEGVDREDLIGVADNLDLAEALADSDLDFNLDGKWDGDWEDTGLNALSRQHEDPRGWHLIRPLPLIMTWLDI